MAARAIATVPAFEMVGGRENARARDWIDVGGSSLAHGFLMGILDELSLLRGQLLPPRAHDFPLGTILSHRSADWSAGENTSFPGATWMPCNRGCEPRSANPAARTPE